MPQRPPSNSARKIAARPIGADDAADSLPTDERRTIAPELLLDSNLALEKYKLPILLGVTLLILAAIGFGYYESYQARNAAAASALLDGAKTEADYQKVIATYPGSNAAANASLLLGRAKYNAKDYAGAAQVWQDFAAKFPHHSLVPDALIGEAGALEAQGKPDAARAMYQRVATSYQSSFAAPLARISEATLLLSQRKTDEAKHVYEDVIASSPKSDASQMAEQGLRTLNALPPLGGSSDANTPPAPAAAPAPAAGASPAVVVPPAFAEPAPATPVAPASPVPAPTTGASPAAVVPPAVAVPSAAALPTVVVPPAVAEPPSTASPAVVAPPGTAPSASASPAIVAPPAAEPTVAAPAVPPVATPAPIPSATPAAIP